MPPVSMTWPEYLAGCCRIGGRLTRLTFQEADILSVLLLQHPDRPLPLRSMIERVWPVADREPGDPGNVISTVLCRLRRRGIPIKGRRGFGFRIPREGRGIATMRMAA